MYIVPFQIQRTIFLSEYVRVLNIRESVGLHLDHLDIPQEGPHPHGVMAPDGGAGEDAGLSLNFNRKSHFLFIIEQGRLWRNISLLCCLTLPCLRLQHCLC